jgi:hypothetical protein
MFLGAPPPPREAALSQMSLIHILTSCFFKIHLVLSFVYPLVFQVVSSVQTKVLYALLNSPMPNVSTLIWPS